MDLMDYFLKLKLKLKHFSYLSPNWVSNHKTVSTSVNPILIENQLRQNQQHKQLKQYCLKCLCLFFCISLYHIRCPKDSNNIC